MTKTKPSGKAKHRDFVVPRMENAPLLLDEDGEDTDRAAFWGHRERQLPYTVDVYQRLNIDGPKGKRRWHITVFINQYRLFNIFEYTDEEITQEDINKIVFDCLMKDREVMWLRGDYMQYSDSNVLGIESRFRVRGAVTYECDLVVADNHRRENLWANRVESVEAGYLDPDFMGIKQGKHTGERNHNNGTS